MVPLPQEIRGFFVLIRFVIYGFVFVAAGCKKDEPSGDKAWQNFASQYAHIYCDLRASCDIDFETEFGDQETCRQEVLTNENKGRERRKENGCEFDAEEGDFCIEAATLMSCDDWLAGGLDESCGGSLWSCD